ncbi:hypothetical protein DAPPUDRAFT_102733 [Daphnia pulex]|uniref:Uncharacterized protein n=1 Tax=Daphnia pulex TaxID=6669 RepID=E9GHC2_DAPPU|nr:hypothetical protein DAPPUDRAFT_102733 [Daphnia pulex]|eukprot:EFX81166.1 hypothetical protein DAPPUDRAFT_102733 [Daphnia pulex]
MCPTKTSIVLRNKCCQIIVLMIMISRQIGTRNNLKIDNTACIFCKINPKHNEKENISYVQTLDFKQTIIKKCKSRNDSWANEVLANVICIGDLFIHKTCYHISCYQRFVKGKNKPSAFHPTSEIPSKNITDLKRKAVKRKSEQHVPGQNTDNERKLAFLQAVQYLEEMDEKLFTIKDFRNLMGSYGCEPYSTTYIKSKLLDYFGCDITFFSSDGIHDIICLSASTEKILHAFYLKSEKNKLHSAEERKLRTMIEAAKIIIQDLKTINTNSELYDIFQKLESPKDALEFVPVSLQIFLTTIITAKSNQSKIASVAQSIMQLACPKTILAPLQIGLAVQLHLLHGSRALIDILHSHGFCSSYNEVLKFERSAAVTSNSNMDISQESFVQYVADNADHNLCTLDGKGTFHGMGIIATITPCFKKTNYIVPRKKVTIDEILQCGEIKIIRHSIDYKILSTIKFRTLEPLFTEDRTTNLDLLWLASWSFKHERPGWQGCMDASLSRNSHPGKSEVVFLPMIDMSASDENCIYSTLHFIATQAQNNGYSPILTFDQPLWWKAMLIIENADPSCRIKNIILKLGGFHTLMSFLSSIGHVMAGSGIEEILSLIYAENTVPHMLSGKAYTRAVRGFLLLERAINALFHENTIFKNDNIVEGNYSDSTQSNTCDDVQTSTCLSNVDCDEINRLYC